MQRNNEIDRLRAVAVIATIYAHMSDLWLWKIYLLKKMMAYTSGYDGVLLFFVISGFVISESLIPKIDLSIKNGENTSKVISVFFIKRFFRITPNASVWVFLSLMIFIAIDPMNYVGNIYGSIAALFNYYNIYTHIPGIKPNSFGIFWTLSIEAQFYIFLPFTMVLCKRSSARIYLMFIVILISSVILYLHDLSLTFTPVAGGVLLYLFNKKYNVINKISSKKIFNKINTFSLSIILTIFLFIMPNIHLSTYIGSPLTIILQTVIYSFFVCIAATRKNAVLNFPHFSGVLNWIGSRSFTLYLSHLPIMYLVRYIWMHFGMNFGFSYSSENNILIFYSFVVTLIIVADVGYRLIELPMTKIGHKKALVIELSDGQPMKINTAI